MENYFENAETQLKHLAGENDALIPNDSGDYIFGAYCSADFLNNAKVMNLTSFFTFAPLPYLTYYWTVVRKNLEWYNGYVFGIHNKGILSSRIGSTTCNLVSELTLSGGFRFKGETEAVEFAKKYAMKNRILAKLKRQLPLQNAIGFMLVKVDVDTMGNSTINFVPGNRYYVQTDNEQHVTASISLIVMLSADPKQFGYDENSRGYYLVEERFYRKNRPCIRFRIHEGPVLATAPLFDGEMVTSTERGLAFDYLPKHVQNYILRRFNTNVLNQTFYLPFDDLGVTVAKASYSATGMDDYDCFADGILANVTETMYEYDLTVTQKEESKYLTQDFAAVPDEMIPGKVYGNDEQYAYAAELAGEINSGMNRRIVKRIRYMDPSKATPFVYQPQVKMDAYGAELDRIAYRIAAGAHLSPATLAGYLRNGVERTAREVTADENNTRLTITEKRGLLAEALDYAMNTVLKLNGYVDDFGNALNCQTIFNAGALSNPYQEAEYLAMMLDHELIDPQTARAKANPDLDEESLQRMADNIAAYREERQGRFGGDTESIFGGSV